MYSAFEMRAVLFSLVFACGAHASNAACKEDDVTCSLKQEDGEIGEVSLLQHALQLDHAAPSSSPGWKTIDVYTGPQEVLGSAGQLHSQVGQDWIVATLLGCKHDGYFIDLAANDAVKLSNTLMLERDFGWKGVCIEANMKYMYGLAKRQCRVVEGAVGATKDEKVKFNMDGVLGGIVSDETDNKHESGMTVEFHMVPLVDVLEKMKAPSVIDYLSLDVEGAESIVMNNFPWETYRFNVITVERPKADLRQHLTEHGYMRLKKNSNFDDETWVSSDALSKASLEPISSCMTKLGYPLPVP